MNICFFYDYFGNGGSEKYSLNLAEHLQKNHQVYIIFGKRDNFQKPKNVKFINIKNKGLLDFSAVFKIKNFFYDQKIEIVHVHYPREQFLVILAKILGAKIKIVRTYHRMDRFNFKNYLFEKIFGRWVDKYISLNQFAKRQMIKNGVNGKKIVIIPNGSEDFWQEEHEKNIGFLGRIEEEKGIYEVAKLWPHNGPKLIIAGTGEKLNAIQNLKNKNIVILGEVKNLNSFFQKISVLILPSKTETMPLSVVESFSAGVPVVSFDLPALRVLITNKNGILVNCFDFNDIVAESTRLLKNNQALRRKSKAARKSFDEDYRIEKILSKIEKVYREILVGV